MLEQVVDTVDLMELHTLDAVLLLPFRLEVILFCTFVQAVLAADAICVPAVEDVDLMEFQEEVAVLFALLRLLLM